MASGWVASLQRRVLALVRLVLAIALVGGAVGATVGYAIGRVFGTDTSTAALTTSQSPAAPRDELLTVIRVVPVTDDGAAHWHGSMHRIIDGSARTGITSVPTTRATVNDSHHVALKFQLRTGMVVDRVTIGFAYAAPRTVWLIDPTKPTASAQLDGGTRAGTYDGKAKVADVTLAHPVHDSWFEMQFVTQPRAPHGQGYGQIVTEVAFYGHRASG